MVGIDRVRPPIGCNAEGMEPLATTPDPPYYAVIFTSIAGADTSGYGSTAGRMLELAAAVPGFLGVESVDGATEDGRRAGLTVSYWRDEASIAAWRDDVEHTAARAEGRERWYDAYELRVARVERATTWRR